MTTFAHRSALRGPRSGGIAARRPLIRWAWRIFRREWRQQILVIALLTVAVAAAIGSVTIAYNSASANDAEFGSANHLLELDGADPRGLEASLAALTERFGTTDVIGHRSLAVPGGVDNGGVPFSGPARTVRGRAPRTPPRQLPGRPRTRSPSPTVSPRSSGSSSGRLVALDGRRRTVVGIVENPRDLSDEFALVSPSSAGAPDYVTVLVDASDESVRAFLEAPADGGRSACVVRPGLGAATSRHLRWRCSRWPPSSCSWRRSLPQPASPSSLSDGSASSACSPRSARPRSTFDSYCCGTARSSARSAQ